MASEVDLVNLALGYLGQEPIIRVDETTVDGRRVKAVLPIVRKETLRADAWRCALKRVELPKLADKPLGYSASFRLPNDFVKLVALKLERYKDWELLGNNINTNLEPPLQIMYVHDLTDTEKYSPELLNVMALRLALQLSGYVSTSTVRKQETYELWRQAMITAMNLNAMENPIQSFDSSLWVDARYSNIDRGIAGDPFYSVG